MQLINSLTFASIVAIPAIGSAITSTSGHSGVVIKTNGRIVLVSVAVSFVVGDTFTDTAEITVYQPRVIPWLNNAATPITWLNNADTPIPWQSTILDPVQESVLNYGALTDVFVQSVITANDTAQAKFANSPIILAMIGMFNSSIDPSADIDAFYNDIWNIDTAQGYGLDVWGRIVGVNRIIKVAGGGSFGYQEGSGDPLNVSAFYSGVPTMQNYPLSDTAFRLLILVKAFSNISRASVDVYNQMLMQLFPSRGNAYVSDTGGMRTRLTFEFYLQPFEVSILKQSGALAMPTGVGFDIMDVLPSGTFGFAEAGQCAGFNQGSFFEGFE